MLSIVLVLHSICIGGTNSLDKELLSIVLNGYEIS